MNGIVFVCGWVKCHTNISKERFKEEAETVEMRMDEDRTESCMVFIHQMSCNRLLKSTPYIHYEHWKKSHTNYINIHSFSNVELHVTLSDEDDDVQARIFWISLESENNTKASVCHMRETCLQSDTQLSTQNKELNANRRRIDIEF